MKDPAGETSLPALTLRAGDRVCAVPLAHVSEIMRALPIERLAGAPPAVLGLALIRGATTPVVDLDALLSDQPAAPPPGGARFVVLRVGERSIALCVHEVLSIRMLDRSRLDALPPLWRGPRPPAVAALGARDRELLLVLEAARLLPAEAVPAAGGGLS